MSADAVAEQIEAGTTPAARRARLRGLLRQHRALAVLLAAGAALRIIATMAYVPALWFPDSAHYLISAQTLGPDTLRPLGYSAFLRLLFPAQSLLAVAVVQHLLGLGVVVGVYALLRRHGVATWLAVLAAAPMALDAYEIQIEQYVLAETLFTAVLLLAVALLLWRATPTMAMVVLSGVLFAVAGLTRTVGLPLAAVAVVVLVFRRVGWRRVGAFALAFIVPVLAYSVDFKIAHGTYGVTSSSGRFLYGRAAVIVDCDRVGGLDAREQALCAATVQSQPRAGSEWYDWNRLSPSRDYIHDAAGQAVLQRFAKKVIVAQPMDFLALVASDSAHYFAPGHDISAEDSCDQFWQFESIAPTQMQTCTSGAVKVGWLGPATVDFHGRPAPHHINRNLARALNAYQGVGYTPGPLLAVCVLAALGTVVVRLDAVGRRLRTAALFAAALGVVLIVLPSATAVFDYRYGLPLIALCPLAGALSTHAYTRRRRRTGPAD